MSKGLLVMRNMRIWCASMRISKNWRMASPNPDTRKHHPDTPRRTPFYTIEGTGRKALMLLICWWCWCTDADALMHWCWCANADALLHCCTDALMHWWTDAAVLMHWCWCTDADALRLMHWCWCWMDSVIGSGSAPASRTFVAHSPLVIILQGNLGILWIPVLLLFCLQD